MQYLIIYMWPRPLFYHLPKAYGNSGSGVSTLDSKPTVARTFVAITWYPIRWGEKALFFCNWKWPLQKVGKWSKTPNSIEIFQLLPLVFNQHKAKSHTKSNLVKML